MIDPHEIPAPLIDSPKGAQLIFRVHQIGPRALVLVPPGEHLFDDFPAASQHPTALVGSLRAGLGDDPVLVCPSRPHGSRVRPLTVFYQNSLDGNAKETVAMSPRAARGGR